MAADQTLIAAAGKMGPAKVDYSGYMKAIGAVGKYINTKNAIAQEYIGDRPDGMDISEMPKELLENEDNKMFFENSKENYNKAVKVIRNQPAFTKKYREAVKKINDIKQGFENVKNGLVQYAEYRKNNFVEYTSMSQQTGADERNFQADMVINNSDGFVNSKIRFSNEGITFDGVNISEFPAIKTNLVGLESASIFNRVIENSVLDRERGRDFDSNRTKSDIQSNIDLLIAKGGYTAIKSLAYDAKFTDSNGVTKSFMDVISEELNIDYAVSQYKQENPEASASDIQTQKQIMLAEAWQNDQNEELTARLTDHLYELADRAHHSALDYSKGGKGSKTEKILGGANGQANNWNTGYPKYIGWKYPEQLNSMVDKFESGKPFLDWFGNTYVPTFDTKGADNVGNKRVVSYKVIQKDQSGGVPMKNLDGKGDMILSYKDAYLGLLFEYKRSENNGNDKAKYD